MKFRVVTPDGQVWTRSSKTNEYVCAIVRATPWSEEADALRASIADWENRLPEYEAKAEAEELTNKFGSTTYAEIVARVKGYIARDEQRLFEMPAEGFHYVVMSWSKRFDTAERRLKDHEYVVHIERVA